MANVFNNISDFLSGGNLSAGQTAQQNAVNLLGSTQVPDLSALIPVLQQQVKNGNMTPAQAVAAIQGSSAYQNINVNPQTVADQEASINQLKEIASSGGLTPADKAQLNEIQQQLANQNSAQQQAIQSAAQQQGLGSSGADLAAKMVASQGNATGAMNAGSTVAANAQQRALQAMQQYGQQSNILNNSQFAQQKAAADAQNAINQFNAQNTQQANLQNATQQNQVGLANQSAQNAINANNTSIANANLLMPYQAAQQNYSNTQARNQAAANAMMNQGTALINQGNSTANTVGSVLGGALGNPGATSALGNAASAVGSGISNIYNGLTGAGNTASTVGQAISDSPYAGYTAANTAGYTTGANDAANAIVDTGTTAADTASNSGNLWDTVSNWFSDERIKEDIKPADDDIESMMEQLTGKKFKYKSGSLPDDGGKEHLGVMAQDAEKAGLNTQDTPYGKMIKDDGQMKGAVLAALGNLHSRVANLEK